MAYEIPFSRASYVIPDSHIKDNTTSKDPVTFHLVPAGGPDKARLKSITWASYAIGEDSVEWSKDVQDAVIASFGRGAEVFVRCVERIEGLTIPGGLAKLAGIIPPDQHDKVQDAASIPVKTGVDFAMISGYVVTMAFLVAMEIVKISRDMEVDRRLFDLPSGSSSETTPSPTVGTAVSVPKRSGRRATAG